MKKITLAVITVLSALSSTYAQKRSQTETGFVIGPNISTVFGGASQELKPGLNLGGYIELPLTYYKKASINIGLQYALMGYNGKEYKQFDPETLDPKDPIKLDNVNLHYLQIPITFNFYTDNGIGFFVGGQAGYLIDAQGQFDINHANKGRYLLNLADNNLDRYLFDKGYRSNNPRDFYESFDYGVVGGMKFDLNDKMFLSFSAYYGLSDMYKKDNNYINPIQSDEAKNSNIAELELMKFMSNELNFSPINNFSFTASFGYRL